jgi:hypothetical protein
MDESYFRREILFEKLNPGCYSFEVYATDRLEPNRNPISQLQEF